MFTNCINVTSKIIREYAILVLHQVKYMKVASMYHGDELGGLQCAHKLAFKRTFFVFNFNFITCVSIYNRQWVYIKQCCRTVHNIHLPLSYCCIVLFYQFIKNLFTASTAITTFVQSYVKRT